MIKRQAGAARKPNFVPVFTGSGHSSMDDSYLSSLATYPGVKDGQPFKKTV
ncbi:Uncharacterized protein dnl_43520 [Desulfonema limicola]|uniref:Uncharacterized protein n=1 Tax=Desulfonema limicola TaxID=45656 RepID=A0A975BAI8_9BACT|nr:Uncharacterized protein dnl_43520 [Desulfonema limicola]